MELRSIDARSFYTDSAGTIALSEPALMRQDVFFQVLSFGYRFEQELLGWRGTTLQVEPGGSVLLKMRRRNVAERYDGSLGSLTPEQSNALSVMVRSEARLESLIEDLIQFGLAARGELKLTVEAVDINTLIPSVVGQASKKADAKNIVIRTHIPTNLTPVLCDEEKIGWVVAQLLDNAIKFTPPEGEVSVEVFQQNGVVTISVIDTGIGIPAERYDEIYEPFHQLDSSSTRRYGGTGLGLALSTRILEAHDTQFVVKSQTGVGSQFSFSLPIAMSLLQSEQAPC